MPKILVQANYIGEGLKGLIKDGGTTRRAAIEKLFASVGGTLESLYFAFGDTDVVLIGEVPDHVSAAALSLKTNATGLVRVKITTLLTAAEIDAATKKTVTYSAPGQ